MAWLNRIGLVLEFVSVWLAAPEILGERRLRALHLRLELLATDALRLRTLTSLTVAIG